MLRKWHDSKSLQFLLFLPITLSDGESTFQTTRRHRARARATHEHLLALHGGRRPRQKTNTRESSETILHPPLLTPAPHRAAAWPAPQSLHRHPPRQARAARSRARAPSGGGGCGRTAGNPRRALPPRRFCGPSTRPTSWGRGRAASGSERGAASRRRRAPARPRRPPAAAVDKRHHATHPPLPSPHRVSDASYAAVLPAVAPFPAAAIASSTTWGQPGVASARAGGGGGGGVAMAGAAGSESGRAPLHSLPTPRTVAAQVRRPGGHYRPPRSTRGRESRRGRGRDGASSVRSLDEPRPPPVRRPAAAARPADDGRGRVLAPRGGNRGAGRARRPRAARRPPARARGPPRPPSPPPPLSVDPPCRSPPPPSVSAKGEGAREGERASRAPARIGAPTIAAPSPLQASPASGPTAR